MITLLLSGRVVGWGANIVTHFSSGRSNSLIKNPPGSLNTIHLAEDAEIAGHLTTYRNNAYRNDEYLLNISKTARGVTKYIPSEKEHMRNYTRQFHNAIILRILTYSLQLSFPFLL